jgi:uncharacterized protein (DUF697 family)
LPDSCILKEYGFFEQTFFSEGGAMSKKDQVATETSETDQGATEASEKDQLAIETSEKAQQATETIKKYALYATGAGFIPMPLVDWAAISAIQVKMVHDIAGIYNVPFNATRIRSIVASLIGGGAGTSLGFVGQHLVKAVPVVGPVLGALSVPAMAGAATWAMGKVFIMHFASGGTLLDFDPDEMRQYFKAEVAAKVK